MEILLIVLTVLAVITVIAVKVANYIFNAEALKITNGIGNKIASIDAAFAVKSKRARLSAILDLIP